MTTVVHDVGDLRRCSAQFKNFDGELADPTSIVFSVKQPDGTKQVFTYGTDTELEKDGVGQYHIDYPITQAGRHVIEWLSTGVPQLSEQSEFHARRSSI